ncbi:MAG TPA: hypothetical protein VKT78_03365 [Fimbriimonadaceae bacterium]|nr:hypothetical protein [Fimbriimonadaceae bacterium]
MKSPDEPWTPKRWTPRVTGLLLIAGFLCALLIANFAGWSLMRARCRDLKRFATRDMATLASAPPSKTSSSKFIESDAWDEYVELRKVCGRIQSWDVTLSYSQFFGTGGGAVVFVHGSKGDMRWELEYPGVSHLASISRTNR